MSVKKYFYYMFLLKMFKLCFIIFILSFQIEILQTKHCLPFESAIVAVFLFVDLQRHRESVV